MGFGVDELLNLFYFQAPVFVSDDLCDTDRFASRLPRFGLQLVGDLWVGAPNKQVQ
jgi:hypothetical protein